MTFSDIVTVLGAGAGILLLLTIAAAPLLADLDPNPRGRAPVPAGLVDRAASTPARTVDVPAPRSPSAVEAMARVSGHARHAAAR
ncbi:hypothetical protein EV383_2910 [Pseudonocardia sediminis]|uniref:Uncharacterized protein n=1 Tax=Pseudonocardia sediminis TaxID=1397368 RepID=A0A4Q7UVP2_PSEST|nr:hypothetical protein [Pseudonocardia sediminis]RZT86022.1 hypothetical protein EV383_2910 [Pseudonocardia sediminis]